MANSAGRPTTITLGPPGIRMERAATEAITPGQLVMLDSADGFKKDDAAQPGNRMFALEDDLQGNDIDDIYAIASRVQVETFKPGDEVFAFLADGETAIIGSYLISNADGELAVDNSNDNAIAFAREALDMSDSSTADPTSNRIKVQIL